MKILKEEAVKFFNRIVIVQLIENEVMNPNGDGSKIKQIRLRFGNKPDFANCVEEEQ